MYAEIKLSDRCTVYNVFMKAMIDRRDEFMQKLLVKYRDGEFDAASDVWIKDRVKVVLRNERLITDSGILKEGQRLINECKIQVNEEGQYNMAFIKNGLTKDRVFLYFSRDDKIRAANLNRNKIQVHGTLYDKDQRMMVRVDGSIEGYLESPGTLILNRIEVDDDKVLCSVIIHDADVPDVPYETNISPEKIIAGVVRGYDVSRNAVVIDDLNKLGDEEIRTLSMDIEGDRNQGFNTNQLMKMEITDLRVTGLPLCARDEFVAEKWMDELRERNWGRNFVSVEDAKADQEYWSTRLLGEVRSEFILTDEELLENLEGKEAFWGVAAMMDLVPDHGYRNTFYITPDSDIKMEMTRNIFNESVLSDLKHVVVVDPYIAPDSHKVLYELMGRKDIGITYVINNMRNRSTKGRVLRKEDVIPDGVKVIWDPRNKNEAHSRWIILLKKDGSYQVWGPDNSMNSYKMVGDRITTNAHIRYHPISRLRDKYIENVLEGIQ